jgi:hypothetical protein
MEDPSSIQVRVLTARYHEAISSEKKKMEELRWK